MQHSFRLDEKTEQPQSQRSSLKLVSIGEVPLKKIFLSVKTGAREVSLRSDRLKAGDVADSLKRNKVKSRDMLPLFEVEEEVILKQKGSDGQPLTKIRSLSIAGAGTKVENVLDDVQRLMLCSANKRWWIYSASDELEINALIAKAQAERDRLLAKMTSPAVYQAAKDLYEARLRDVLTTANALEDYDFYRAKFPTVEQLASSFFIEQEGPFPVMSAAEAAKQSPELQVWMSGVRKSLQEDLPRILEEGMIATADFLKRIEESCGGDLLPKSAEMLARAWKRIKSLLELHHNITADCAGESHPLISVMERCLELSPSITPEADTVKLALDQLRDVLTAQDWISSPTSPGAKSIAAWCGVAPLEDRIRDLKAKVAALQAQQDRLAPDVYDRRLKNLQSKIQTYADLLKMQAADLEAQIGLTSARLETVKIESVELDDAEVESKFEVEVEAKAKTKTEAKALDDVALAGF